MLSADMMRYVELHRAAGFQFRTQHQLLSSFAAFAERMATSSSASNARSTGRLTRPHHLNVASAFSRSAGLHWRCAPRMLAMRFRRPMRWAGHSTGDGSPISTRLMRSVRLMQAAAQTGTDRFDQAADVRHALWSSCCDWSAHFRGLGAAAQGRDGGWLGRPTDQVQEESALVPLHATAQRALDAYIAVRAGVGALLMAPCLSRSAAEAPAYSTVVAVFLQLARSIGLRGEPGQRGPRIHDLRHTFAVRALEQCGHDGNAIARHLVALSTYLGHVHATSTYWYLQATPILMEQIADVSEALHQGGAP